MGIIPGTENLSLSSSLSSFNKFRLAERIQNIGCLVNPAFTQDCSNRLGINTNEPLIQKVALLPFMFTQRGELIFMAWGAILVAAIASTYRFYRIG